MKEKKIIPQEEKDEGKRIIVEISQDLQDILDKIKLKVNEFTWGAEPNLSNYKASKILANRIIASKLY